MIVTTNLIRDGYWATTLWPFIFVLPDKRGNVPLIEHELVHYREQAWITPIWLLRYIFSRSFRMGAEVRAYKRQIELGGITVTNAANMLLTYDLNITFEQAQKALT